MQNPNDFKSLVLDLQILKGLECEISDLQNLKELGGVDVPSGRATIADVVVV
ncbi:MAG: hypothetical protein NVS9B14_17560 [Candidatus Acidiferrum sp.]